MNIEELEKENDYLTDRVEELETKLDNIEVMCDKFQKFIEPCAIGHEQLWKIVREDIQGLSVPNGQDLRELI